MEKYYFIEEEQDGTHLFTIYFKNNPADNDEEPVFIAAGGDIEKIHFLTKAANSFKNY